MRRDRRPLRCVDGPAEWFDSMPRCTEGTAAWRDALPRCTAADATAVDHTGANAGRPDAALPRCGAQSNVTPLRPGIRRHP